MIDIVTDNNLMAFCKWFSDFHGNKTSPSVFTTCLCGFFHTNTRTANQLLKCCKSLKLVNVKGGELTIVNNNDKTKVTWHL